MHNKPTLAVTRINIDSFSNEELLCYCVCQALSKCGIDYVGFTPEQINFMIYHNKNKNINETKSILRKLNKYGLIGKYFTSEYSVTKDDFLVEPGTSFFLIYVDELGKIINSNKKNKAALLKHWFQIIMSLDIRDSAIMEGKRGIVGHMPISYFSKIENLHQNTIIKMNKSLEELGILYINRVGYNTRDNSYGVNCYGRVEDSELIDLYARQHNYSSSKNQNKANSNRSITQRYNHFVRTKGNGYNLAESEDLLKDIEKYNNEMNSLSLSSIDKVKYAERIKDLTPIRSYISTLT